MDSTGYTDYSWNIHHYIHARHLPFAHRHWDLGTVRWNSFGEELFSTIAINSILICRDTIPLDDSSSQSAIPAEEWILLTFCFQFPLFGPVLLTHTSYDYEVFCSQH